VLEVRYTTLVFAVSILVLSGCQNYTDLVSNRPVISTEDDISQQLARAVQNYREMVSNLPMPSTDDARKQACTWIRSAIAQQQGLGDAGASIARSPLEAALFRGAALQNIAALESRASNIQCSGAFSNTPVTNSQPKMAQPTPATEREEIPLESKGGVYTLPVLIDRVLILHFILDTGAAEVNIPADVALTLIRAGTIKDPDDFLPGAAYTLADGTTIKSFRFTLRSLTLGSRHITNVPASIGEVASPLLLGQSFLKRLGMWSMDSQRHVLVLGPPSIRNEP